MALVVYDRVQETTTTTGTGSVTLDGAVAGFQSFAVVGNGNTTFYCIADQGGGTNWEVGIGTYSTTGPTLARTTVLASSNSGSLVTFTSGTKSVFVTYPAEKSVNLDASGNVTALGTITSGVWNGTTVPVAYGGTGVTSSSGANSVVLRDSNQNIAVNSVTQNLTKTTSAGGTTTLTLASSHFQVLTGTSAQTYKLPDATSLSVGTMYIFDNDSTQNLTVVDNATGTVDVVAPGGYTTVFLEANGTVAGEWGRFGMLPNEINWGTNSLDLASTVVSGGTWQGGTIQPGYGGTGLTGFSAANNALYSTSSSALTAGTLPVAAGGTGATTLTGYLYGNGTSAVTASTTIPNSGLANSSVTVNGTTISLGGSGTISAATPNALTMNNSGTGDASGSTFDGSAAKTISYNSVGAAPSAGSTSIVSLGNVTTGTWSANAVGITYGGTGQTTASAAFNALSPITTAGDLIIGNGSNSATRLGIGASGYVLQSNGTTATWASPPGSSTLNIQDFTATAGQTTFSLTYTVGLVEGVYRNGIKLGTADYDATNGTSIVLTTGALVGDLIEVVYFTAVAVTNVVNTISFGSTGLTPSTAATGAVTVAGTLGAANGGTGLTSPGTSGNVLQSNGSAWVSAAAPGATISGTTSAGTYYVVGTTSTSGSLSTAYISNTNAVSYNANTGALTAVSVVSSSDERLKSNIQTLTNAVKTVENLRGVSYLRNDRPEIGVVAQEVEKVLPMLVHEDPEGYKSVAYGNMVGLLIEAVKELSAEVKALKAELNK